MDSITQAALGAVVGSVIAGKPLGRKAMAAGALAATLPDLDIIASLFVDDTTRLLTHRSATHSLLVMPAAAWLLAHAAARWRPLPRAPRALWFRLFFWCFITHITLDWCTVYGTQLFFPLTTEGYALSIISIVDPFYTVPLLIALVWLIATRTDHSSRRKVAVAALAVSSVYLASGMSAKHYAHDRVAEELAARGAAVERQITHSTLLNIFLWETVAMTGDGYYAVDYSFLGCGVTNVRKFAAHPLRERVLSLAEKQADARREIRRLLRFSRGFYEITDDGDDLIFTDLRFGVGEPHPFRYSIAKAENETLRFHARAKRAKTQWGSMAARMSGIWRRMTQCGSAPQRTARAEWLSGRRGRVPRVT